MMLPSSWFYNALANVYDEYCHASNINAYLEKEIDLVQSFNPQSILEFGIGDGRFTRVYLVCNPGVRYVGVDNAEGMLDLARDSGATLVCSDFGDYLEKAISENIHFDCIVAPYTAIHHIDTINQLDLFEKMKQVADVLVINCLTTQGESIFRGDDETEVTVQLALETSVSTVVHRLNPKIRALASAVYESEHREFLIYPKISL